MPHPPKVRDILGIDVWVDEVCNIMAIQDLWHDVILPLIVLQLVKLLHVHAIHTTATCLLLSRDETSAGQTQHLPCWLGAKGQEKKRSRCVQTNGRGK